MQPTIIRPEVSKLRQRLRRARIASWWAIEQGDCHAVARLTCEAGRLVDAINSAQRTGA